MIECSVEKMGRLLEGKTLWLPGGAQQVRVHCDIRTAVKVKGLRYQNTTILTALGGRWHRREDLAIVNACFELLGFCEDRAKVMLKGTGGLDSVESRHDVVVLHRERGRTGGQENRGNDIRAVHLPALTVVISSFGRHFTCIA